MSTDLGDDDLLSAVALQKDGKIVAVGATQACLRWRATRIEECPSASQILGLKESQLRPGRSHIASPQAPPMLGALWPLWLIVNQRTR